MFGTFGLSALISADEHINLIDKNIIQAIPYATVHEFDTSYGAISIKKGSGDIVEVSYTDESSNSQTKQVPEGETIKLFTSTSPSEHFVEIVPTGITQGLNIELSNVDIALNATGPTDPTAAIYITGTGDVNFQISGVNNLSNDYIFGVLGGTGLSTRFSAEAGVNVAISGSGELNARGYDTGIYIKSGSLTISGDVQINAESDNPTINFGHGIYLENNATAQIDGGKIYCKGKDAGFSTAGDLTITGGEIEAVSDVQEGISLLGSLHIFGGTITANANTGFSDISSSTIVINGGSIKGELSSVPENSKGETVYLNTLTLEDTPPKTLISSGSIGGVPCTAASESATGEIYGINDVKTDADGKLYFYLTPTVSPNKELVSLIDENSIRYQNRYERGIDNLSAKTLYKDKVLKFEYKNASGAIVNQNISVGYSDVFDGTIPTATAPTGYSFTDWFTSGSAGSLFDFTQSMTSNKTAYAQYAPIPIVLPVTVFPNGTRGQFYSHSVISATGGVPNLNYTVSGLPTGLIFNPATMEIRGVPATTGTFNFNLIVTDNIGQTKSVTLSISVVAPSGGGNSGSGNSGGSDNSGSGNSDSGNSGSGNGTNSGGGGSPSGSVAISKKPNDSENQENKNDSKRYVHAYMRGYPDGTFKPNENMTRAEAAALFARINKNFNENKNYMIFLPPDVDRTEWYANYLGFCLQKGFLTGYKDGTFRPSAYITRAEFSAAINKGFDFSTNENFQVILNDIEGHWAEEDIRELTKKGIVNGYPNGNFESDKHITRAEVTVIINKVLDRAPISKNFDEIIRKEDAILFSDVHKGHWAFYNIFEASNDHEH